MRGVLLAPAIRPNGFEDLRPLKPFMAPDYTPMILVLVGLVAIALGIAYWVAIRRRFGGRPRPPTALMAIAEPESLERRLKGALAAIEVGNQELACDLLAQAARDVACLKWGVRARPLTTSEIVAELGAPRVDAESRLLFKEVLEACDLVRFAEVRMHETKLRGHLDSVRFLLDYSGGVDSMAAANDAGASLAGP